MPLGIRPINDFAFKKVFGTPENLAVLISLLNAILKPTPAIVNVTLSNPFNLQDFEDDKLSVLDVKAVDRAGAIYDVEMQLETLLGLVKRCVFYGCELYAGQLIRISQITEDKAMYDAREKLIRDRLWAFNAAKLEGEIEGEARGEARGEAKGEIKGEIKGRIEGKIELVRTLQGILNIPVSGEQDLRGMTLEQLEALTSGLQDGLRNRPSS